MRFFRWHLALHLTGDTAATIETENNALSLLPDDADRDEYEAAVVMYEAALKDDATERESDADKDN